MVPWKAKCIWQLWSGVFCNAIWYRLADSLIKVIVLLSDLLSTCPIGYWKMGGCWNSRLLLWISLFFCAVLLLSLLLFWNSVVMCTDVWDYYPFLTNWTLWRYKMRCFTVSEILCPETRLIRFWYCHSACPLSSPRREFIPEYRGFWDDAAVPVGSKVMGWTNGLLQIVWGFDTESLCLLHQR